MLLKEYLETVISTNSYQNVSVCIDIDDFPTQTFMCKGYAVTIKRYLSENMLSSTVETIATKGNTLFISGSLFLDANGNVVINGCNYGDDDKR